MLRIMHDPPTRNEVMQPERVSDKETIKESERRRENKEK
jgi:hypothetical protein